LSRRLGKKSVDGKTAPNASVSSIKKLAHPHARIAPAYAKASAGRHGLENRLKGNGGKLLFEVCVMKEDKVIGEELHQRTIIEVAG